MVGVWATAVAVVAVGAAGSAAREPVPLAGAPLEGKTGIRLVVADVSAFVLDVDTGKVTRVRGVPVVRRGTLAVVGVGGRAAVVVAHSGRNGQVYAAEAAARRFVSLGAGRDVVPATDGRSVWVKSVVDRSRCTLRRMGIDGRELDAPASFRCRSTIAAGGSLGLIVNRTRMVDPVTRRTVLRTRWGILAAAGRRLVLAGPDRQLALLDGATGRERRLRWPSVVTMLDQPAVDPRGNLVALAFATPAWKGRGRQVLDVWLLDTRTGRLVQLPGMPAFVALKATSLAWTQDGRLVLLGESEERDVFAVWRPGQRRLALKLLELPLRGGGSDTFAPV
jgi:hypothetical protein